MKYFCFVFVLLACHSGDKNTIEDRSKSVSINAAISKRELSISDSCGLKSGRELTGDGIGELRIGRAIEEVRGKCQIVRDTVELEEEAQPQRTVTVVTPYGDLHVVVDSGRIWRVTPTSSGIRTTDSLGLGSTIADLLKSSPGSGVEGEGALYVILQKQCGLSFRLAYDIPYADHRGKWSLTDLEGIQKTTKVDQVFAIGCDK